MYGSSYGTYLAQGLGVRHPQRVAGMVLDSPILGADDVTAVRANLRALLWDGAHPDIARPAELLRRLVADGVLRDVGFPVQIVYEFAGPRVLERLLDALRRRRARRTWDWVAGLGKTEVEGPGTR